MTQADLQTYRRSLLTLRRSLGGKIEDIRGDTITGGGEADSGPAETLNDSADQSVHEYEEQVDRALAESEVRLLEQVNAALARIDAGTFGRCPNCGKEIGQQRLQAVPYATHCIECARQQEQG